MKFSRLCSWIVPLAIAVGCGDPTGSDPPPVDPGTVYGTWVAEEEASPQGRYTRSLTFGSDHSFVYDFRSYGLYGGQSRDELSYYSRIEGTFGIEIEGPGLIFHPARQVWWDRFYGGPERVDEPYPGAIFDDARVEIRGRELTLHFTSYPADASEPARFVFTRAP